VSYTRKRSNLGPKIEKGLHFLDYRVIYLIGPKSNFLLPTLPYIAVREMGYKTTEVARTLKVGQPNISRAVEKGRRLISEENKIRDNVLYNTRHKSINVPYLLLTDLTNFDIK